MSDWTAADVPDRTGRTAVVTGANGGLGLETTRILARKGARVVMACRSLDRGERAVEDVRVTDPDADLDVRELDLASLDSVAAFADGIDEPVDLLVNNAGVMWGPYRETEDGFEAQFGINHLGHFALTGHLLDRLRAGESTRVVTVSSALHSRADGVPDEFDEREYDPRVAYARSKLANLLFAYELDRRADRLTSAACHPGWAATDLQTRGAEIAGNRLRLLVTRAANALLAQDPAAGALPTLYAATAPDVVGGGYYGPSGFMNMCGPPERQASSEASYDREAARRLWSRSEALTGVEYDLSPSGEGDEADAVGD
jgi:NAD(P)-dependent dehydrogenase (short-subunit alcohol dehydrogenase family)